MRINWKILSGNGNSTIVEIAKVNGVNVYHYITFLFENSRNDHMSDDELEWLIPCSCNEGVKAEIKQRLKPQNQSLLNCIRTAKMFR